MGYAAPAHPVYVAPAPVVEYISAAPAVSYAAPAPPVPAAPAPVVEYISTATLMSYAAPTSTVNASLTPVVEYLSRSCGQLLSSSASSFCRASRQHLILPQRQVTSRQLSGSVCRTSSFPPTPSEGCAALVCLTSSSGGVHYSTAPVQYAVPVRPAAPMHYAAPTMTDKNRFEQRWHSKCAPATSGWLWRASAAHTPGQNTMTVTKVELRSSCAVGCLRAVQCSSPAACLIAK